MGFNSKDKPIGFTGCAVLFFLASSLTQTTQISAQVSGPPGISNPAAPLPVPVLVGSGLQRDLQTAASRAYQFALEEFRSGEAVNAEQVFRWSRRWMEAEAAGRAPGETSAIEDHIRRMKVLETLGTAMAREGKTRPSVVAAARYYRIEAEVLLQSATTAAQRELEIAESTSQPPSSEYVLELNRMVELETLDAQRQYAFDRLIALNRYLVENRHQPKVLKKLKTEYAALKQHWIGLDQEYLRRQRSLLTRE